MDNNFELKSNNNKNIDIIPNNVQFNKNLNYLVVKLQARKKLEIIVHNYPISKK